MKRLWIYAVVLLLIPSVSYANTVVGFLVHSHYVLALFAFLCVWIIESLILRKVLSEVSSKILLSVFVANIITSVVGFIFSKLDWLGLPGDSSVLVVIKLLVISLLLEFVVIKVFYRDRKFFKVLWGLTLMNVLSYLFLLFTFFVEMLTVTGAAVYDSLILLYLLYRFFVVFLEKRWKRDKLKLIIPSLLLVSLMVFWGIRNVPFRRHGVDARIIAAMSQLRSVAAVEYDGTYDSFSASDSEMVKDLSDDIQDQGSELIIHTDDKAYCAFAKIHDRGDFCIDSTGSSGIVKDARESCNESTTVCP